jgi:hypothetical protein
MDLSQPRQQRRRRGACLLDNCRLGACWLIFSYLDSSPTFHLHVSSAQHISFVCLRRISTISLSRTIVKMSDSMKRNANGAVVELEDEPWPTHPSNQPYKHSADSENKKTDVNQPDP